MIKPVSGNGLSDRAIAAPRKSFDKAFNRMGRGNPIADVAAVAAMYCRGKLLC